MRSRLHPSRHAWTGRRRIYVLKAEGWCKDMDRYTLEGETIDPIPFSDPEGPE
ncbi:MAG: hypothetical protein ACYS15_17510 [Planctomycetota bacterium]